MGSLESDEFKNRYGSLTKPLKDLKWKTLALPLISYMRSVTLVMVLFTDSTTIQLLCYRISQLFFVMYVGYFVPFSPRKLQRDEQINGVLLLLNSLLMPLFTDFVPDPEVRYKLGWAQVGLIAA